MENLYKITGSSMVEYALIIGLIAGATVAALTGLEVAITSFFANMDTSIDNAGSNF